MKLIELQVGDKALITSKLSDVTVFGTVFDRDDHGFIHIAGLPQPLVGDHYEAILVEDWPKDELLEAKRRARLYLAESQSNVADKIMLERALEIAFGSLKELHDKRQVERRPFWKRSAR